jgi:hypothetical protein
MSSAHPFHYLIATLTVPFTSAMPNLGWILVKLSRPGPLAVVAADSGRLGQLSVTERWDDRDAQKVHPSS